MTILQTPYESTTEKGRQTTSIKEAIMAALASGNLDTANAKLRIMFINRRNTLLNDIQPFQHPIQPDSKDPELLAVDLRPYVRETSNYDNPIQIVRPSGYQLQMARTLFTHLWITENPIRLLSVSSVPMGAYADWLASPFAAKVNAEELLQVRILAAYFYYCQFTNSTEFTQAEVIKLVQLIARSTNISLARIAEVFSKLDDGKGHIRTIHDINDFCKTCGEIANSPRVKTITPEALVPTLAMTWDGRESMPLLATAVEHPPTWIAFVLMACISRPHQRSRLSESVIRVADKKNLAFVAKALMTSVDYEIAQELGRR